MSRRLPDWAAHSALIVSVAAVAAAALPASAGATAASETITGGSLSFMSAPSAVAFPPTTLNGSDQTQTQTQTLDVGDARGTGAGWNVTATSTAFYNGTSYLPNGSTTVSVNPPTACDASVTCTVRTNSGLSYPYTLPAAAVAPAPTKFVNAAAATGLGAQTVTPTWNLAIPASAAPGSYTSTWTFSLVSGP